MVMCYENMVTDDSNDDDDMIWTWSWNISLNINFPNWNDDSMMMECNYNWNDDGN